MIIIGLVLLLKVSFTAQRDHVVLYGEFEVIPIAQLSLMSSTLKKETPFSIKPASFQIPAPSAQTDARAGDLLIPNLRSPEPLAVECQHFVDCLRTRSRPLADAWSGVVVTAALEAADRSLARGGAPEDVHLPERG